MTGGSPEARLLQSPAVRIRWLAAPRALARGGVACGVGLLLVGALIRLTIAVSATAGVVVLVPLGYVGLLLALLLLLCAVTALVLRLTALFAPMRPGTLWIDEALWIHNGENRHAISLSSVMGARISPKSGVLALESREGDVVEASVGMEEARNVLDRIAAATALGTWMARLHRSEPLPWWQASPALGGATVTLAGLLVACPLVAPEIALSLGLVAGILWAGWGSLSAAARDEEHVILGRDGLAIQRSGRPRFIAFARIAKIDTTALGVALTLASGERLELGLMPKDLLYATAERALDRALAEKRRAHLVAALEAAIAASHTTIRGAALLERRGRSVHAWRAELKNLVSEGGGGYRQAMLSKEQVSQVLEDGRAPPELRIGAALALARENDERTALRLRLAIQTCVNPAMRVALTQARSGDLDDASLERALEEDEEPVAHPSATRWRALNPTPPTSRSGDPTPPRR